MPRSTIRSDVMTPQKKADAGTPTVCPWPPTDSAKHKGGYLRLGFELDARNRTILRDWERRAPMIVQQALYFDEQWSELPCVYILCSGGPMLEGDRYLQQITLQTAASAHISTGAATKVAPARSGFCHSRVELTLYAGAYLEYLPEPTIPCRNACYDSEFLIRIADGGSLILCDTILCGRKYSAELFEYGWLRNTIRAERHSGRLLFCDQMFHSPQSRPARSAGRMGRFDIRATVYVISHRQAIEKIYASFTPLISDEAMAGLTTLHEGCALRLTVLGMESGEVKRIIRDFCSLARQTIKGRRLPEEFVWR